MGVDDLSFVHNGESGIIINDGQIYTAEMTGEYIFYINEKGLVYVEAPEPFMYVMYGEYDDPEGFSVLAENPDKAGEYVITLDLAANDSVIFFSEDLDVYGGDNFKDGVDMRYIEKSVYNDDAFWVKYAGTYTFYVDTTAASGKNIYFVGPEVDFTPTAVITRGEDKITPTLVDSKPAGSTDIAQYTLELRAGDKITFFMGVDDLSFVHNGDGGIIINDGQVFTAAVAGEYTFYINAKGLIYVAAPAID